ncbi:MAG: MFS transporter [Caulobacteraceae bacterium]
MQAVQEGDEQEARYPGLRGAWWMLILMFGAAVVYSIDRGIVGVMAEPIRKSLAISDVQMSLLLGLAYVMFSCIFGLLLGNFSDRYSRRKILAYSIILWSLSTMACGLAPNFGGFFFFRALVGLGEAGLGPAALSLISDIFPPRQRGRALSGYFLGATLGTALASVLPGMILKANLHLNLPGFGAIDPWRSAFVLCGLAGPAIGLLLLTTREPARQGARWAQGKQLPLREKLAYLWSRRPVLAPLFAGFSLFYVAFIGISNWTVVFLTRAYHSGLPAFAGRLGIMAMVAGTGGYLLGGLLADSAPGRRPGGKLNYLVVLPLIGLPSSLVCFCPSVDTALVALGALSLATPMLNVAMNAVMQEVLPNEMRGFSFAMLTLVSAVIAGMGGPLVFALVTQHLLHDPTQIGYSFLIVGLPVLLAASVCFVFARRAYRRQA